MPNRDYARPKSSKNGGSQLVILLLVALILLVFGLGLWLLKTTSPAPTVPVATVTEEKPKSTLPSRPEEVYSYIRDLETREVPVDKNTKFSQLSAEQERQIQQRKKEEEKQLEAQTTPDTEQTPEQKAAEAKLAEEKRKQAELKKQEEAKLKAEQAKQEQLKAEQIKQEQAKVEQAKPAVKNEEPPKPTAGKFGLQCGAFKNKAQAENMQARLSMAGYNARISSSAEWNRVFVGPVGDRSAAVKAQSNAKSVAECLVVAM